MLNSVNHLKNFVMAATDGDIGRVKDLYFDDDAWTIRYLVVDTGSWLQSRKVLISPISLRPPKWPDRSFPVSITRDQVKNSPSINTQEPVSRQNEEQFMGHYGYPYYWDGRGIWGEGLYPYTLFPGNAAYVVDRGEREQDIEAMLSYERARHRNDDPHLRSCHAVVGYHISAIDGEIGHVSDYLVDDETWAIRYLVVDTSNWLMGRKVLISPSWINDIQWTTEKVSIDLTRELIKAAPIYDPATEWDIDFDRNLFQHYSRPGYWDGREIDSETTSESMR